MTPRYELSMEPLRKGIWSINWLDSRSNWCPGNAHSCIERCSRKQVFHSPQDEIAQMSAEKFEAVKKVLKVKKAPKLLTLSDQFWQFYKEISSQQYHFNRVNVEASLLKEIAHEEVLNFYQVKLVWKLLNSLTACKWLFRRSSHLRVQLAARSRYTCSAMIKSWRRNGVKHRRRSVSSELMTWMSSNRHFSCSQGCRGKACVNSTSKGSEIESFWMILITQRLKQK